MSSVWKKDGFVTDDEKTERMMRSDKRKAAGERERDGFPVSEVA
jgi:hypothetical protein